MALIDLLPAVQMLSHDEKLKLVEIVSSQLKPADADSIVPGRTYEIWSPFDSYEAAAVLQKMLDERRSQ